ncbi:translocation/assembly module TamB domain-containing protein [Aquabacter sp. L1I39]|uniref:translocation/assembly module TamB domain-containing protein n=1 Tax=Aquabacter sp. L1I39 TaxID=2820278 RepID=UPI001ADB1875|nr:translocation/assembly module TamB domain-containing protein [Aquabacter sp. L1I39]QTL04937.1 translocation/assembly module TamB domain-containing protein [Aquabacter sp. L1I39]
MRALRLVSRSLISLAIFLVGFLLAGFGLIQTPPGRDMVASLAGRLASGDGLSVRIEGLSGFIPSNMRVASIDLSDPDGPFARVEGLSLAWSPLALLSGSVTVALVSAERVTVQRQPDLPPRPAQASSQSGFARNLRVIVDRIEAPAVDLDEPVFGQKARFGFEGGLKIDGLGQGLSLNFNLNRRDAEGFAAGTVRYAPETAALDVDITAREPAGGIFARLAGLEGLPAFEAQVKGAGTLDAWSGTLDATAGDLAHLEGSASVRAQDGGRVVQLTARGDVGRALPKAYSRLFEGESDLSSRIVMKADGGFQVDALDLRSAGFSFSARGGVPTDGPITLTFQARTGAADRYSALLPGLAWDEARLDGGISGTVLEPQMQMRVNATKVTGFGYGAGALKAEASAVPDGAGTFALKVDATGDGLSANDPKVAAALGPQGTLALRGVRLRGEDPVLTEATVRLSGIDLRFAGKADLANIEGRLDVARLDLAALSPFAGRPLAGLLALTADVKRTGAGGAVALSVNGTARDVTTGDATLDGLAGGASHFKGGLSVAPDGAVAVDNFTVDATGAALAVNGRIDATTADLAAQLSLPDLTRLDGRLEGAAQAKAAFSGRLASLDMTAQATIAQGKAMGHAIEGLAIDVAAKDLTGRVSGTGQLQGKVGGKASRGTLAFSTGADGSRALTGLDLAVGSVTARGAVTLAPTGLATGDLTLVAGDLADISALTLTELGGRAEGTVSLDAPGGVQRVTVRGTFANLLASGQRVANARIDLSVTDPRVSAAIQGSVDATGIEAGTLSITRARLTAQPEGQGTRLALDADAQGATLTTRALLARQGEAQRLRVDTLRLARDRTTATLTAPATLTYEAGNTTLDRFALALSGGGSLTAQGRAGDTLDLTLEARAVPLALAALVDPTLSPSGTLAANARITGTPAAPTGRYDVTVNRATMPQITAAGAGPFDFRANGTLADGRASIASALSGPSLSGVTINGFIPVSNGALDLTIRGSVSLAIANAMLATSGARAAGTAAVDLTLRGTLEEPRAGGTIRISGGRYEDAIHGITLERIQAVITGTDRSLTVSSFQAFTPNGGSIQGQGTIALDPAGSFPGRVDLTLNNAQLANSELIRLVAGGRLALSGALARTPAISGTIEVREMDVNIPDRLPGGAKALNVRHVNLPPGSRTPAALRQPPQRPGRGAPSPFVATLDLTINAPNRVFVRGMGLDAELAGNIQVRGTSAAPQTIGGFEMLRGRLEIIGRRLDFTRGRLTFNGDTDPDLDFVAESAASDVTARIIVSGRASQPEITFTSTPELPQDEVVARLLFGRSAGQLSAGQALQVAQAVTALSGQGNALLGNLRRSLGVDSLSVGTNAAGTGGEIGIGRRINDRLYLGVRQGTTPNSSQATIDLDLTRNIRLQGATGADGNTSVGIGAQWDY